MGTSAMKKSVILLLLLVFAVTVFAQYPYQYHYTNEIGVINSSGDWVSINDIFYTQKLCIGNVCRTTWPGSSGDSGVWNVSGDNVYRLTGNVGIGISEPISRMHINTTKSATPVFRIQEFYESGNATYLDLYSDGLIAYSFENETPFGTLVLGALGEGNQSISLVNEKGVNLHMNRDGNIGIGTTEPQSALDVNGTVRIYDKIDSNLEIASLVGEGTSALFFTQRAPGYDTTLGVEYVDQILKVRARVDDRILETWREDELVGLNGVWCNPFNEIGYPGADWACDTNSLDHYAEYYHPELSSLVTFAWVGPDRYMWVHDGEFDKEWRHDLMLGGNGTWCKKDSDWACDVNALDFYAEYPHPTFGNKIVQIAGVKDTRYMYILGETEQFWTKHPLFYLWCEQGVEFACELLENQQSLDYYSEYYHESLETLVTIVGYNETRWFMHHNEIQQLINFNQSFYLREDKKGIREDVLTGKNPALGQTGVWCTGGTLEAGNYSGIIVENDIDFEGIDVFCDVESFDYYTEYWHPYYDGIATAVGIGTERYHFNHKDVIRLIANYTADDTVPASEIFNRSDKRGIRVDTMIGSDGVWCLNESNREQGRHLGHEDFCDATKLDYYHEFVHPNYLGITEVVGMGVDRYTNVALTDPRSWSDNLWDLEAGEDVIWIKDTVLGPQGDWCSRDPGSFACSSDFSSLDYYVEYQHPSFNSLITLVGIGPDRWMRVHNFDNVSAWREDVLVGENGAWCPQNQPESSDPHESYNWACEVDTLDYYSEYYHPWFKSMVTFAGVGEQRYVWVHDGNNSKPWRKDVLLGEDGAWCQDLTFEHDNFEYVYPPQPWACNLSSLDYYNEYVHPLFDNLLTIVGSDTKRWIGFHHGLDVSNRKIESFDVFRIHPDGSIYIPELESVTSVNNFLVVGDNGKVQKRTISTNIPNRWLGDTGLDGQIYRNGRVGIGTSSPKDALHVKGGAVITDNLFITNSNRGIFFDEYEQYRFGIFQNNENALEIRSLNRPVFIDSGNVGIGTNNPDAKLRVAGDIRAQNYVSADGSVGVDGSFMSQDGKNVTVKNGLIVAIE
ncbi:MAG: hypothetical protein ACMXYC_01865 [Candidatus Woesearchaeota archaeon]